MKKVILSLAIVAAAATSAMAQISVGAGYLNANTRTTLKNDSSNHSDAASSGFYAGADAAYDLGSGLSLTPGIYYGMLHSEGNFAGIISGKTVNHFVSVPVNFNFGYAITNGLSAFAYAGPSFSFCLASNTTTTVLGTSSTTNNFGDNSSLKRFDIYVGAGLGVIVANVVRVSGGYNYGLLDQNGSDNFIVNNSGWHIGAAFLF